MFALNALDFRWGHFADGAVEVNRGAARVFNRVGDAARFEFGSAELAVARVWIFAGGENFHRRSILVGQHHGGGGRVVYVEGAANGD